MGERPGADRRSAMVIAAAIVVILAGIHAASALVVPLTISVIVTVLVTPLEHRLLKAGWRRIPAFGAIVTATMIALVAVFWAIYLSLTAFVTNLPSYQPGATQFVTDLLALGRTLHVDLTHLVAAGRVVANALAEASTLTRAFLSSVAGWTVVLLLTAFMLYEALDYPEKAKRVLGDGSLFERTVVFTRDLSRFMGILSLGALLTAVGDLVVLIALGIPSAALWAALAFLLSYIPNVGSIIIVIPPTIATLVRYGFVRALIVLLLMLAIDNIVGAVVVPRLIGRRLSLAPFWGMLSVIFWAWLVGPVGAILAVPLTMFAKFLLESSPTTMPAAVLMKPLLPVEGKATA